MGTHEPPETFTGYASCPPTTRERHSFDPGWLVSLLIALYLLLVIVLPLALSAAVSYRTLPEGRTCPLCGSETLRLRARFFAAASVITRGNALHRRWCLTCGWEGTCRMPVEREYAPPPAAEPPQPRRRQSIAIAPGQSGEAVNLRKLEVDGSAWRVLLQCWCDADQWYGRLLFIAPSGRLWVDTMEPFSGATPHDVMVQALALPDRTLACRLRELISD